MIYAFKGQRSLLFKTHEPKIDRNVEGKYNFTANKACKGLNEVVLFIVWSIVAQVHAFT